MSDVTVRQAVEAFLNKKVRGNQTAESWLINDFLRGIAQMEDHYERDATVSKAECEELYLNCHIANLTMGSPRFDQEFERLKAIQKDDIVSMNVRRADVFSWLNNCKSGYDISRHLKHLVLEDLLPRLNELRDGATATPADSAMVNEAYNQTKRISRDYSGMVSPEFKLDDTAFNAFIESLKALHNQLPKWSLRIDAADKNRNTPTASGEII